MSRLLFSTALLMLCLSAHADQYYQFIAYSCNLMSNNLTISYTATSYEGEYNPITKINQWELSSLIEITEDDRAHSIISKINNIERQCKLKNSIYTIIMAPAPGNHDLEGRCGGHLSAWVQVRLGENILLPNYNFDPNGCDDLGEPITTKIIFDAGSAVLQFKTVPPDEFYK